MKKVLSVFFCTAVLVFSAFMAHAEINPPDANADSQMVTFKISDPEQIKESFSLRFDDLSDNETEGNRKVLQFSPEKMEITAGFYKGRNYQPSFYFRNDPDKTQFEIVDNSGNPLPFFTANGDMEIRYIVRKINPARQTTTSESPNITANGGNTAASAEAGEAGDITTVSANKMLQRFIRKTKYIDGNPKYKNFLNNFGNKTGQLTDLWYDSGGTDEQWNNMSDYGRMCWALLYRLPKNAISNLADSTIYRPNLNNLLKNDPSIRLIGSYAEQDKENGGQLTSAVIEAWTWHWNNWEKKSRFINVFDGDTAEITTAGDTVSTPEYIEISTAFADNKAPVTPKNIKKSDDKNQIGEHSGALGFFTRHWIDFAVIIAAVVVFLIFKAVQKRKNW